jgi:hypothetical protein
MSFPHHVNCFYSGFELIVGWLHLNGPFWLDVKVEPVNGRLVELLGRQFKP